MKTFVLSFFFLIGLSALFSQKMTIVDYYKKLPDSISGGYKLKFENNKWKATTPDDIDITPTVDIKNGFISFYDEGTGGGINITQAVLYRKKDGNALIGVSRWQYDLYSTSKVYFLELENDKWKIVTNTVLPEISYKLFMNPGYVLPKFDYTPCSIFYDLPRYGTTINLFLKYELINYYIVNEPKNSDKYQKARTFEQNIKTDSLKLYWDKENTKFYFK